MNKALQQRLICLALREGARGDVEMRRLLLHLAKPPVPPPQTLNVRTLEQVAQDFLGRTAETLLQDLFVR